MTLTKVRSTLPSALEELAERTIGLCLNVHTATGPGLPEHAYVRACQLELQANGISYDCEKSIPIRYRDRVICTHRLDLLVEGQLIVEAKSVERIHRVHIAQAVSYLRAAGLRLALVVNFNVESLRKEGIRRVVL